MKGPIAIVGRACLLPGASSVDELETAVFAGRDAVRPAPPPGRFRAPDADILGSGPDRAWSLAGGYVAPTPLDLSGVDVPSPAALDPLFGWLLHAGRAALLDAGVEPRDRRLARCGAVVGNLGFPNEGFSRFGEAVRLEGWGLDPGDPRNAFTSGLPAQLLASGLGLGGGGFALDAACASALYAIKLACDALHAGRADRMLAGAVQRADSLFLHIGFCALGAMSRTGQSRPFHRDADGLVPAEGAALVVLRRLEDAVRDGDRVFGVIRGVGLSNDGRARNLLAPSEEGQIRALRAAYAAAGLRPSDVQLVECHATGTPTGDKTEIASLSQVFGASRPHIGSLKSMLGHLITAAGVAGLLKVIAGFRQERMPPTLHAEDPIPQVADAGFKLLHAPREWDAPIRRAAVSAFGFGGNNAHLVVEEHRPGAPVSVAVREPPPSTSIVVIGLAAADGASDRWEDLVGRPAPRRATVDLPLAGLRFPPNDLRDSLAQQALALRVGADAAAAVRVRPDRGRIGIYVGMRCDATITGWGLRWRAGALTGATGPLLDALRDAAAPSLRAEHVVGTMPNIPANRLNVQIDAGGPGFTVSAEELSGARALRAAMDALAAGEIDLALVGAVDLGGDPRMREAHRRLGHAEGAGTRDGAAFLCLTTAARATEVGESVLATIVDVQVGRGALPSVDVGAPAEVPARPDDADAARVLLAVARAIAAHAGHVRVTDAAFGGESAAIVLRTARPPAPTVALAGPVLSLPAHPELSVPPSPPADATMSPAPALPRSSAPRPTWTREPAAIPRSEPVAPVAAAPADRPPATTAAHPWLGALLAQRSATARAHASFLDGHAARMSAFHEAHAARTAAIPTVVSGRGPASLPPPEFTPARPAPIQVAPAAPATLAPPPVAPRVPVAVPAPTARPTPPASVAPPTPPESVAAPALVAPPASAAPGPAAPARARRTGEVPLPPASPLAPFPKAEDLPGPKLSRAELEDIASGPISRHFGPAFAPQDAYARVVRMPEPPLLLCDRVLGIAGPPMVLGRGTIWTETDIRDDSWFVHDGHIRGGVFIEAGQADLLLASWQGIDVNQNRGERIYRLLGCDLTYRGGLPGPGDTLRYDIHVDGHARLGAIRMFFFHYDCRVDDALRLCVRNGQAGFFSDAELAESGGVLWDPATEPPTFTRLDPPRVPCTKSRLTEADLQAFAEGRVADCFGPGFERASAHTHTPRIPGGDQLLLHRVTDLDARGGPWGRGYLRAEWDVSPDDWFFRGHFHGDPCMPGTLMFDGCLHALAVFLTSLGYTLPRDGWRFEPAKEEMFRLRCRGQVVPGSKRLIYELFVQDVHAGDDGTPPYVRVQMLCTVDGLKCFHADALTLELVPDYPMSRMRELPLVPARGAPPAWDHRSLLACAWGRPSEAFGAMYERFDAGQPVARLPGPPYHFMSRVTRDAPAHRGAFKAGASIEVEYDVPPDAWYFEQNPARTMPFAVLLEAALQPCGWLASYIGCTLTTPDALLFRNLDGDGRIHRAVTPDTGTLVTTVDSTRVSRSGGMIIVGFKVRMRTLAGDPVYDLDTVFGFFPPEAFAKQAGVGSTAAERAWLTAPGGLDVDLRSRPTRWFEGPLALPGAQLLMIDRLTGRWTEGPEAGAAGLGRWRATKHVDSRDWFFKAHFYRDPVQPGSLGIEAMIQLLMAAMIDGGAGDGFAAPVFEPVASGETLGWKYRGQVVPENREVTVEVEITRRDGALWVADAWLWVDGLRIYAAKDLAVRVVERSSDGGGRRFTVPVPYDHAPTFVLPSLPMTSMAMLALAAGGGRALTEGTASRWLTFPNGPRVVDARVAHTPEGERVTLSTENGPFFSALVRAGGDAARVAPPPPLKDPKPGPDGAALYASGRLFHGAGFHVVERVVATGVGGATLLLRPAAPDILLDGVTHGVPHDAMETWAPTLPAGKVAYPWRLESLSLYGAPPSRPVRAEVRLRGLVGDRLVRIEAWVYDNADALVAHFVLLEALLPKGRIGAAAPADRRDFLLGAVVPGVALSAIDGDTAVLTVEEVAGSDWLPGTVARVFGAVEPRIIAAKELGAARLGAHPREVSVSQGDRGLVARAARRPVRSVGLTDEGVAVGVARIRAAEPSFDLDPTLDWWRARLGGRAWPGEALYTALARSFLADVHVAAPEALAAARGQPLLFLANHQNYLESALLTPILAPLLGAPVRALAKVEHQDRWLGQLHALFTRHPDAPSADRIVWFDQSDPASLPSIARAALEAGPLLVHVEGTRQTEPGQPIAALSSVWVDLAVTQGAAIVPVAFRGGLTGGVRHDLPPAPQVHWVGAPIEAAVLAALPYAERRRRVAAAIDALGAPEVAAAPTLGGAVPERLRAAVLEHAPQLSKTPASGTADAWWAALRRMTGVGDR